MYWYNAILKVIKEIYEVGDTVHRADIVYYHLNKIINLTGSTAQQPEKQVTPNLDKLCNLGYLEKISTGKYKVIKLSAEKSKKGSLGERAVRMVLDEMGITYEEQKKFPDLKDKLPLSYDFFFTLKNKLFLLEFDGAQHFAPVKHWGGPDQFEKQKAHDAQKTNYAAQNGYILVRFSVPERESIKVRLTRAIYARNLKWYLARNYAINLIIKISPKKGPTAAILLGPKKLESQRALIVYYKAILLVYKVGSSWPKCKRLITLNLKLFLTICKILTWRKK